MNILKSILTLMLLLICFCFISGSFFGIGSHFSNSVKTMAIQRKWISETCIYLDTDHLIPFSSWNRLTRDLSLNTGISRTSISFANSVIISDLTDRWVFRLCDGLWLGLDGGKYSVSVTYFMWPFKSRSPRIGGPRSIRTLGIVLDVNLSGRFFLRWILYSYCFQNE